MTDLALVSWKCECGVILGAVTRAADKTRSLTVFTPATKNEALLQQRCESSMVELQGRGSVKCPYCGRVRGWFAQEEATSELIAKSGRTAVRPYENLASAKSADALGGETPPLRKDDVK